MRTQAIPAETSLPRSGLTLDSSSLTCLSSQPNMCANVSYRFTLQPDHLEYRLSEKLGGGIDFVYKAENVKHVAAEKEAPS
jgi:hypothetical protein